MGAATCLLNPAACAGGVLKGGASSLFTLFVAWVVGGVQWIVHGLAAVLDSTGSPAQVLAASRGEFAALTPLAPVLLVVGLVVATLQALRHGDSGALWRTYLGVAPACVAGVVLARPVGGLVLTAVDQASTASAAHVATHVAALARFLAVVPLGVPGAALGLIASLLAVGSMLVWCELVVRTLALALLLAVVPVVVPLCALPSLRRLGWRLAETFAVVAASKLVIVVTLALGTTELTTPSMATVVAGAVTLLLATVSPFVLLRLVPVMESTALAGLEGLRARAARAAGVGGPGRLAGLVPAPEVEDPGPPTRRADLGIPMWEGVGEITLPEWDPDAPRPAPPVVGERPVRRGHVAVLRDRLGPVVGWHWDD
ncbi:MAG TPA: hypothetical protein VFN59_02150 [Acidimicrobiales bacterium]|nr:hypothetical protein [Acidimicrobiales bacterium]